MKKKRKENVHRCKSGKSLVVVKKEGIKFDDHYTTLFIRCIAICIALQSEKKNRREEMIRNICAQSKQTSKLLNYLQGRLLKKYLLFVQSYFYHSLKRH